jgi:hypothetical protein
VCFACPYIEGTDTDAIVIFPKVVTLGEEVTVADIQWHLNYLKDLYQ